MLLFQYEAVCGCVVGTVRYDKYCAVAICDWLFKLLPESWLITGWFIYSDSISDVKYSCIRNLSIEKRGKSSLLFWMSSVFLSICYIVIGSIPKILLATALWIWGIAFLVSGFIFVIQVKKLLSQIEKGEILCMN